MIVIFDTFAGLCNQFFDIYCGINFCIINNIKFTFRYCSFRIPDNLNGWYNSDFNSLFDLSTIFKQYEHLYVDFSTLNLTSDNTYNFESLCAIQLFSNNYVNEIKNISKEYIILKQFWSISMPHTEIVDNLYPRIKPSKRLMDLYENIKNKVLQNNEEYNFIHYRFESDFLNHFNVTVEPLENILLNIKNKFKNPELKIYIATSNIKQNIDLQTSKLSQIIVFKDDDELTDYNFEEKAMIDFMFGLNSNEVFGNRRSSFSVILNYIKDTSNFYV
jgi:hypothetical protein